MTKLLAPLILLVGVAGGGAAALVTSGAPEGGDKGGHGSSAVTHAAAPHPPEATDYVKFARPFIVPIVAEDEVVALAMLTLAIELPKGEADAALPREPKVRDALMQALIALSHDGYLSGDITDPERFAEVRTRLRDHARSVLGDNVADVLIIDYARQAR